MTCTANAQARRRSQAEEGWLPAEAIAQTVLLHQTPNDASFVTDSIRRGELLWVREISPESEWLLVRPPEGALSWVLESDISEIRNGEARVKAARTLIRPGRVGARLPGPPGSELVSGDRIWLLNREPLVLPQQGRLMTWRAIEPPAGEPRFARRENLKRIGKSAESDEANGFVNAAGPGNLGSAKPQPEKKQSLVASEPTGPEAQEPPQPSLKTPDSLTDKSNISDEPAEKNGVSPGKAAAGKAGAKPSIESLAILEPPKSLLDNTALAGAEDSPILPRAMPFESDKSAKTDQMQFGTQPAPAEPAASPLALPDSPDAALEMLESRFRVLMDQPLISWNFKPILDGCDSVRKRTLSPEQAGRLNAIRDKAQRQDEIGQSARKFWDSMRRSRAHDPGKNPDIDVIRASNASRFDISGLLLPSRRDLDGQLLYNLIGDGGSTIAYLKLPPAAPVERWLGKKVGIRGRVRYNEDLRARLVVVQDVEIVDDDN
ncbi:MAG: hypothetical protein ACKO5E_15885 [bacterium]